jgi:hypothetical protein
MSKGGTVDVTRASRAGELQNHSTSVVGEDILCDHDPYARSKDGVGNA